MEILSRFMGFLCETVTVDIALFSGLISLAVGFVINLILSVSCRGYKKRHRKWVIVSAGCALFFVWAVTEFFAAHKWAVAIYLFFALPTVYFSFLFKEKAAKITKEHISLAKYLDKKAEQYEPEFIDGQVISRANAKEKIEDSFAPVTPSKVKEIFEEKRKEEFGLDFSHVKNVLGRLDYFSLSPSDKRQVKELEVALLEAESGEFCPSVKERLNDGLGALLKIMSKHGV